MSSSASAWRGRWHATPPCTSSHEPTAHLDTHVRAVFLEELLTRRDASGAGALYATHDAEEALGLADRVALLDRGRLIQLGRPRRCTRSRSTSGRPG